MWPTIPSSFIISHQSCYLLTVVLMAPIAILRDILGDVQKLSSIIIIIISSATTTTHQFLLPKIISKQVAPSTVEDS